MIENASHTGNFNLLKLKGISAGMSGICGIKLFHILPFLLEYPLQLYYLPLHTILLQSFGRLWLLSFNW